MGDLGFGLIILLIVFILVPLINFMIKRAGRPVESETPAAESLLETPGRARATPESLPPTPRASRNEVHTSQALTVETPLSRRRFSMRSLIENPRDVRRGIIIMTILGPCRAFDPRD